MYNAQYNKAHYANSSAIVAHIANCAEDSVCEELMRLFNACNAQDGKYNTDALVDALNEAYAEDVELVEAMQGEDAADIAEEVLGRRYAIVALDNYANGCYREAQHYTLMALLTRNNYLEVTGN